MWRWYVWGMLVCLCRNSSPGIFISEQLLQTQCQQHLIVCIDKKILHECTILIKQENILTSYVEKYLN